MRNRLTVSSSENRTPLLDFLASHLAISKKKAKGLLDQRTVFVSDRRVWMARHLLQAGDIVEIHGATVAETALKGPLFEDAHLMVADKPVGLLSNGSDSFEERLRQATGYPYLRAVHRLDRDTSGCLLLAKEASILESLTELFKAHAVQKTYHVIALGGMDNRLHEIRAPVDGEPALTRVHLLDSSPLASHLKAQIVTGRTHQIRKHLALVRHPVAGDKTYATGQLPDARLRKIPRQMLHAFSLTFPHPITRATIRAQAPLPPDFQQALKTLRLK